MYRSRFFPFRKDLFLYGKVDAAYRKNGLPFLLPAKFAALGGSFDRD